MCLCFSMPDRQDEADFPMRSGHRLMWMENGSSGAHGQCKTGPWWGLRSAARRPRFWRDQSSLRGLFSFGDVCHSLPNAQFLKRGNFRLLLRWLRLLLRLILPAQVAPARAKLPAPQSNHGFRYGPRPLTAIWWGKRSPFTPSTAARQNFASFTFL
jgi:hypothetical protein